MSQSPQKYCLDVVFLMIIGAVVAYTIYSGL